MIQKSEYNFRIRTPPEIFSNYRNNKILNSLLTIQVGLKRSNDFIFLLLVSESLKDINIQVKLIDTKVFRNIQFIVQIVLPLLSAV